MAEGATSALAKQRVEKPVVIVARGFRRWQELSVAMHDPPRVIEGFAQRIRVLRDEIHDLCVILGDEYRAGHVEELPAGDQKRPGRREESRLPAPEAPDVAGAVAPLAVGMAPDDTGGGARHVEQNALERARIPPGLRISCVPFDETDAARAEPQPRHV